MDELIAKRYVKALSESTKDIATAAAILNVLAEAMSAKEVREVIASPLVSAEKKTEMILSHWIRMRSVNLRKHCITIQVQRSNLHSARVILTDCMWL